MKLRTLFMIDAVISVVLALGFLLRPDIILKFFGLTTGKTESLLAQILGAALIGFAVLAWFGKDTVDLGSLQTIRVSLLVFSAIGFIVTLLAVLAPITRAGSFWLLVLLFLLAGAGYAYFQFGGARE